MTMQPPKRNPTQPATPSPLRGVITDEQVAKMREKNEQRAKEAAERLGTGYVLHRNAVPRQPY
jgi:hypothetical protein